MKPRKTEGAIVSGPYFDLSGRDEFGASMPGCSPKILIVDDEPTNIHILTEALDQDYDLVVATSAAQAMEVL